MTTSSAPQPLVRSTANKLIEQAKQNAYVQLGVSKLESLLSNSIPESVRTPVLNYYGPVSSFIDQKVSVVDDKLNQALALASVAKQQASSLVPNTQARVTATANAATAAVSSNLSALRTRLATERAARQQQVVEAVARVQAVIVDTVESNPSITLTLSHTQKTVKQAIEIARNQYQLALNTGRKGLDVVLPDNQNNNNNNNNSSNNNNNDVTEEEITLSSLSTLASRRVRARLSKAVDSVSSLTHISRISVRIPRVERADLIERAHLVKIYANERYVSLSNQWVSLFSQETQSRVRSAVSSVNQRRVIALQKVKESKEKVVEVASHIKKDGVVAVMKPKIAHLQSVVLKSVPVVIITKQVSNVQTSVMARVSVVIDWTHSHAKHFNFLTVTAAESRPIMLSVAA